MIISAFDFPNTDGAPFREKGTYTQHGLFFLYGKMKITNDLYAQVHLKSEPLAV
jgi:hypothetical protein